MVQVKDLTELSLRDLWEELKDEDDWWGDMKQQTLRGVKRLLEGAMEGELMEQLHAGRYRRNRDQAWVPQRVPGTESADRVGDAGAP